MKLITEGNSLRFVIEEGTFLSAVVRKEATRMRTPTKNELVLENDDLKGQVNTLTFENSRLLAENLELGAKLLVNTKPSAGTRVPKEEMLAGLTVFKPLCTIECETHGKVVSNKHGYCYHCYNTALGKPVNTTNTRAQVTAHCG